MRRTALLVSADPRWALQLATTWSGAGAADPGTDQEGEQVTLVLLDAAAIVARPAHPLATRLSAAADAGVVLQVHDGALRRRGMDGAAVAPGVKVVTLDEVADLLADASDRVVWL